MSNLYNLLITNTTPSAGTVCVYQTLPAPSPSSTSSSAPASSSPPSSPPASPPLQSLAWLVSPIGAAGTLNATITLGWNVNYGFAVCALGNSLNANIVPADAALTLQNQVSLESGVAGLSFQQPLTAGPVPGTLTINESSQAIIGFAMSGTPVFGLIPPPATYTFTPAPVTALNIAFSPLPNVFVPGQPIPAVVPNSFAFTFPPNVFSMTATYSGSGTTPWAVVSAPPS